MKKNIIITILVIVSMVFLSACIGKVEDEATKEKPTKKETEKIAHQGSLDLIHPDAYGQVVDIKLEPGTYISVIGRSASSPFWQMVRAGALQAAEDMNKAMGYKGSDKIKVNYSGPSVGNSVDGQINILDEELARYPSAVGIAIIDTQACKVQFDLALENSIPIVAFDSGSDYADIVSMIGTNNIEAAHMMMGNFAEMIGNKGEILLVVHDSKSTTGRDREAGVLKEIEMNYPEITVVKTVHLDDVDTLAREIVAEKTGRLPSEVLEHELSGYDAKAVLQYYIEKYPRLLGSACTNVDATQAIINANNTSAAKIEDLVVAGFDGGEAQMKLLEEGKIAGLVIQNPFGMGYATVVAAARSILEMGNEAVVDTGYIWVTKENMKEPEIKKILY